MARRSFYAHKGPDRSYLCFRSKETKAERNQEHAHNKAAAERQILTPEPEPMH